MPQFNDDIYIGGARVLIPPDRSNSSPMDAGVGPVGRIFVWDVVPALANANNIVANATPGGAGNLPLNAGTGTTKVLAQDGYSAAIVLDTPRAISCGATTGAAPFMIYGLDVYGQPMTELLAAAGTGKKAFKVITRISVGAAGTAVNVGTADIIGMPFKLADKSYIVSALYGGAVVPLANFNVADNGPSTNTTGDVRGTVGGQAMDGLKRLVVVQALSAIQAGPNATRLGAVGVPQA